MHNILKFGSAAGSADDRRFADAEGIDLRRRAELAGGAHNLSEGERYRLAASIEAEEGRRLREERRSGAPGELQQLAARVAGLEAAVAAVADPSRNDGLSRALTEFVCDEVREVESRAEGTLTKAIGSLEARQGKTHAALVARLAASETSLAEVEKRSAPDRIHEIVSSSIAEAITAVEARHERALKNALEAEREYFEVEVAVTRDELVAKIDAKTYGLLTDDRDPKIAEKAIRELRRETRESLDKLSSETVKAIAELSERVDVVERCRDLRSVFTRLISLGEQAAATMAKIGPLEEQFKKLDDEMASLRRILVDADPRARARATRHPAAGLRRVGRARLAPGQAGSSWPKRPVNLPAPIASTA